MENWSGAATWSNAKIDRLVYCTAPISSQTDPTGFQHQDAYIRALLQTGVADRVERGYYQQKIKHAPMAVRGQNGKPQLVSSAWPIMVKDSTGADVPNANFLVSYLHTEEKGSDVNVASHLLIDALSSRIDAAVVISNDSDLRFPVEHVRTLMPTAVINPSTGYTAGALKIPAKIIAKSKDWNWQVTPSHFTSNQLPDTIGTITRPTGW
ncbi:NYN domain-containing protein [Arthrobacter sp. D2-10]